jgi:hypothetical protein
MSKLTGLQRFICERAEQYEGVDNRCKIYICAAKKFEIQFHWHSGKMALREKDNHQNCIKQINNHHKGKHQNPVHAA